jgi:hypothetical protein
MSTIACVATLAACGKSEDPEPSIPQGYGENIQAALDRVQTAVDAGECDEAEVIAQNVRNAIDGLPADVPDDVEQALIKASDNLVGQTRDPNQCEQAEDPVDTDTGATGEEGAAP